MNDHDKLIVAIIALMLSPFVAAIIVGLGILLSHYIR